MPLLDSFDFPVAYDPASDELVAGASFTVHAVDDLAFATPLAVIDPVSGAAISPLVSSTIGVLPSFRVAGDPSQVILKSGSFTTLLTSRYGALADAGFDPEEISAAVAAAPAAQAARDAAIAAKTAAEAVPTTTDGLMTAVQGNPASAFAIAQKATFAERHPARELVGFTAAIATRATSPVDVVVLGDSIAEGAGVAARADRFINRACAGLRTRLGVTASVGGYIPARYVASTMTGAGLTLANRTQTNIYGLGQRSVSLLMDQSTGLGDGTATITVTCSSFKIAATAHVAATSLFVTIDGGTAAVWNIAAGAGEVEWNSGALTPGSHTIEIKARSNSAAYVQGIHVYDGTETSGIRLWDGGQSGTRADQFNAIDGTADKAYWANALVRAAPDLVIIEWMTNDCIVRTSAQYQASLGYIRDLVRSKVANVPILFLAPYERGDTAVKIEPWVNYVTAMRAVAEATANAAFLDLGQSIPKLTGADTYGLLADPVHPNAKGHALMGDLLAGFLLPQ